MVFDKLNNNFGRYLIYKTGNFTARPSDNLVGSFCIQIVAIYDATHATYAPIKSTPRFYNTLTFGITPRCTQIAFQAFVGFNEGNNKIYIRNQHDDIVSSWTAIN